MTMSDEKENFQVIINIESTLSIEVDTKKLERHTYNLPDDSNQIDSIEQVHLMKAGDNN